MPPAISPKPLSPAVEDHLVEPQAFEPDARAQAILRGVKAAHASLAAAGGAYTLEQVQALLGGITRQAVEKRVREGGLLAVPGPSGRRAYPTVQFADDGSPVPGLKAVREALGDAGPWSALSFLVSPHDDLGGRRPVDLLSAGKLGLVLEAARRMDLQGA